MLVAIFFFTGSHLNPSESKLKEWSDTRLLAERQTYTLRTVLSKSFTKQLLVQETYRDLAINYTQTYFVGKVGG